MLGAVSVHHLKQFLAALVALAALMESVCPQRKHRHLACQASHFLDDTVGIAAIHEIIVDLCAHLADEREGLVVIEMGRRVVVPVYSISLYRLEEVCVVFKVALHHEPVFAALRHLAVLQQSHAVDGLILVEAE